MTQSMTLKEHGNLSKGFWLAFTLNFIWINISEAARYFEVVKPMLHETFPGQSHIALTTPEITASWMVWNTILIAASTGFYWIYLNYRGVSVLNAAIGATWFTVAIFVIFWLAAVNMGLVPVEFIWAAVPLAWLEHLIAAYIVYWIMKRQL